MFYGKERHWFPSGAAAGYCWTGRRLSFCVRAKELPGDLERMQLTLIGENGTNGINKEYI